MGDTTFDDYVAFVTERNLDAEYTEWTRNMKISCDMLPHLSASMTDSAKITLAALWADFEVTVVTFSFDNL